MNVREGIIPLERVDQRKYTFPVPFGLSSVKINMHCFQIYATNLFNVKLHQEVHTFKANDV